MADPQPAPSIIEGMVKFRDGKKWKSRWCVMRKLSPVADCLHLQLYKDKKERQKNGQTKASLSLQKFLGFESGFTVDKESNTLAIVCEDVIPVLAFDTGEILLQWRVKVQRNLGTSREFSASVVSAPAGSGVRVGPVRLHARAARLAACVARPPSLVALWDVKHLRRFGIVEGRLCVEGGSRCGKGSGLFVFAAERARELLEVLSQREAGTALTLTRPGSVLSQKRFSEGSYAEEGCCRSVSPHAWRVTTSRTHHCLSEVQQAWPEERPPTSLPRCSSCLGKFHGSTLTRSNTMASTPGTASLLSAGGWLLDNIAEKQQRSDSDRTSLYSRSSGSASDYSVPRGSMLDKSLDSMRGSPVAFCTPSIPAKTGCACHLHQRVGCCISTSGGPYDNYDVPKTPMPLIQEHPVDSCDPSSYYDTPKKILRCITDDCESCPRSSKATNTADKNLNIQEETVTKAELHSNYVNIDPCIDKSGTLDCDNTSEKSDLGNYSNVDLSATLDKFESSLQILRSAGFSQEELDALEDIPEREDDSSTASAPRPSTECCTEHTEHVLAGTLGDTTNNSDNVSTITHISDPSVMHSEYECDPAPRPSSADFIKRIGDSESQRNNSSPSSAMISVCKNECIDRNCHYCAAKTDAPDTKCEIWSVSRLRESVRIRRSSSAPSKADSNRDSSSSNDSGVSTGSLQHRRCRFCDLRPPLDTCDKNSRCGKHRKSVPVSEMSMFVKSSSSDPLKNISFQFEEVATMAKADTPTRRNKPKRPGCEANRISESTSSGASDLSDYMETLSVCSLAGYGCDQSRHLARPRSGNQYLTIDRALLVAASNTHTDL